MQCLRGEVSCQAKPGRVLPTLETGDKERRPWAQGCEGWQEGAGCLVHWASELWPPQEAFDRLKEGAQAHQEVIAVNSKRDESRELTLRDQEGAEEF